MNFINNPQEISNNIQTITGLRNPYIVNYGTGSVPKFQGQRSTAIGYFAGLNNLGTNSIAIGVKSSVSGIGSNNILLNASGEILNSVTSNSFYVNPIRSNVTPYVLFYNTTTKEVSFELGTNTSLIPNGINWGDYLFWNGTQWVLGRLNITLGEFAGETNQQTLAVALGYQAGQISQGTNSISIGFQAGRSNQNENAISIGAQSGSLSQNINAISIGYQSGQYSQGPNGLSIGYQSGQFSQGGNGLSLGFQSGQNYQGQSSVSIGNLAGQNSQGIFGVAIGIQSGQFSQGTSSVSIGNLAGQNYQSSNSISIGLSAGQNTQGQSSVSIGNSAGQLTQGDYSVAIGHQAGRFTQGTSSVAIGYTSGCNSQGSASVAIGWNSGYTSQGSSCVAVGYGSGQVNQGQNSVAIGKFSGQTSQPANSIVLNASGNALTGIGNGTCINPVRTISGSTLRVLNFDTSTFEISYGTTPSNKAFTIQHPLDEDKYLVHYCLEGPEVGVYYRGESMIQNNKYIEIELPDYVSKLAYNFSIQITPIIEENDDFEEEKISPNTYYVSRVKHNKFKVYGKNGSFYWLVHGNRHYNPIIEPYKNQVKVNNIGPYTWIQ